MTIAAMKQALEALNTGNNEVLPEDYGQMASEAITALRAAIKEAEKQEPVVYMYPVDFEGIQKTQTHAEVMTKKFANLEICIPLYTAPRQWQGLTKKEFLAAVDGLEDLEDCWVAIEAKLKEKNG